MLEQLDRPVRLPGAQPPRRPREPLPLVALEPLEQEHLAARPLDPDPRRHDPRVVHDRERPRRQLVRQVAEDAVAHLPAGPRVDEQPRLVPPLRRLLRDQLRRQVVVELLGCAPYIFAQRARWQPPVAHDVDSIRRRRYRRVMDDRYSLPPEIAAALDRARLQVEALAQTADELQVVLPDAVGSALRDGLREEAAPISRRLAEVKGLTNQTIRRLERLETDLLAERHARIDDLALLVDLITGQWRALNERLDRIEQALEPRAQVVELRRPADAG